MKSEKKAGENGSLTRAGSVLLFRFVCLVDERDLLSSGVLLAKLWLIKDLEFGGREVANFLVKHEKEVFKIGTKNYAQLFKTTVSFKDSNHKMTHSLSNRLLNFQSSI